MHSIHGSRLLESRVAAAWPCAGFCPWPAARRLLAQATPPRPHGQPPLHYPRPALTLTPTCRNTGGFDLLGSGRDKIEKPEEFAAAKENAEKLKLDGVIM